MAVSRIRSRVLPMVGIGRGASLGGHAVLLSAASAVGQLCNAALLVVLAHRIDVAALGTAFALLGVASICLDLSDFGASNFFVRRFGAEGVSDAALRSLVNRTAALSLALGVIWLAVLPLLSAHVAVAGAWFAAWVFLKGLLQARSVPLQSELRFGWLAALQCLERFVILVTGTVLVTALHAGAWALSCAYATGALVTLVVTEVVDRRKRMYGWRFAVRPWSLYRTSPAFGVTGLITTLNNVDVTVVSLAAGATQAGLFALPTRVTVPATTVASSLASAALPSLARFGDHGQAFRYLLRQSAFVLGPALVALIAVFVGMRPTVALAFGAAYLPAVPIFRVFVAASCLSLLNQALLAYLQARHQEAFAAAVLAWVVPAILLLTWLGAARDGALGGSFGYLIGNVAICVFFSWRVIRLVRSSIGRPPEPCGHDTSGDEPRMT